MSSGLGFPSPLRLTDSQNDTKQRSAFDDLPLSLRFPQVPISHPSIQACLKRRSEKVFRLDPNLQKEHVDRLAYKSIEKRKAIRTRLTKEFYPTPQSQRLHKNAVDDLVQRLTSVSATHHTLSYSSNAAKRPTRAAAGPIATYSYEEDPHLWRYWHQRTLRPLALKHKRIVNAYMSAPMEGAPTGSLRPLTPGHPGSTARIVVNGPDAVDEPAPTPSADASAAAAAVSAAAATVLPATPPGAGQVYGDELSDQMQSYTFASADGEDDVSEDEEDGEVEAEGSVMESVEGRTEGGDGEEGGEGDKSAGGSEGGDAKSAGSGGGSGSDSDSGSDGSDSGSGSGSGSGSDSGGDTVVEEVEFEGDGKSETVSGGGGSSGGGEE